MASDQSYRPNKQRVPVGVCLVLRRGEHDNVFLIKRTGAHGADTWSFPGGWVEPGEEPERAAIREVWEEAGVIVGKDDLTFLGYTTDKHPEGLYGITMWFETREWQGEPRNTNPDRITGTTWWGLADILAGAMGSPTPLFTPVVNGLRKGLLRVA